MFAFSLWQGLNACRGLKREVTEEERTRIARAIRDHMLLCGWDLRRTREPMSGWGGSGWHSGGQGQRPRPADVQHRSARSQTRSSLQPMSSHA